MNDFAIYLFFLIVIFTLFGLLCLAAVVIGNKITKEKPHE